MNFKYEFFKRILRKISVNFIYILNNEFEVKFQESIKNEGVQNTFATFIDLKTILDFYTSTKNDNKLRQ